MTQKVSPAPVATGSEANGKVFTDKSFTEFAAPRQAQFLQAIAPTLREAAYAAVPATEA